MTGLQEPCVRCPHAWGQHELTGACMVRDCPCQAFATKAERTREGASLFPEDTQIGLALDVAA